VLLPGGNRFLNGTAKAGRGPDLLSDERWDDVLDSAMVEIWEPGAVLRYFYVAGHQPERWRTWILKARKQRYLYHRPTWKDTYAKLFHPDEQYQTAYTDTCPKCLFRLPPTHSCRSFAIPPAWLSAESGTVDRVGSRT
jgi:hypothetical protein